MLASHCSALGSRPAQIVAAVFALAVLLPGAAQAELSLVDAGTHSITDSIVTSFSPGHSVANYLGAFDIVINPNATLAGNAPALAAFYPPHAPGDDPAFWNAIAASISVNDAEMTAFLDSPPQTNEVARSAVLLGGFLTIAEAVRRPLALYELGASAGLNLLFDRYAYDLDDGRRWGGATSPVRISCAWKGRTPSLATPLTIASRAAVDLRPVDARSTDDRERMLAYIWPEQTERLRRIEPALDMVASSGLVVEQGDALAWLKNVMAGPPPDGVCRVAYHSVFFQYLPPELRKALHQEIIAIGERATAAAPLAWLSMEAGEDRMSCELRLTIWPGAERRTLAQVDWHGRWATWG